jgi:hypothetical protein
MSASWSRGPPRGICYFRPNICSLRPYEAKPRRGWKRAAPIAMLAGKHASVRPKEKPQQGTPGLLETDPLQEWGAKSPLHRSNQHV